MALCFLIGINQDIFAEDDERHDRLTVNADTINAECIDSVYRSNVVNIKAEPKRRPNIYEMPYSATASYPNWGKLMRNTGILVAGGAATLLILEALPEDATQWSKAEQGNYNMWQRYRMHFRKGPVWDKDKFIFNGVLHPYGGAAYYMSARSCGFNIWGSFIYSFAISSLFWEYGVECFNEIPSVQDLVITPVVGSIVGEGFYFAKRAILKNNYRILGSKALGYIVAFFLDPVNELIGYFSGEQRRWCRTHELRKATALSVDFRPEVNTGFVGGSLKVVF